MHAQGFVDVGFPVLGRMLPVDHGYLLFSALCLHVPRLREEPDWGVHPVLGRPVGHSRLELFQHSLVQLRVPSAHVTHVSTLGNRSIFVGRHLIRLGQPRVYPLQPATRLRSRCVTVHGHEKPHRFEEALRHELARVLGDSGVDALEVHVGDRHFVRTRAHVVPGFEVGLHNVTPEASLGVQAFGVGGRRYLGLGLFVPGCLG